MEIKPGIDPDMEKVRTFLMYPHTPRRKRDVEIIKERAEEVGNFQNEMWEVIHAGIEARYKE